MYYAHLTDRDTGKTTRYEMDVDWNDSSPFWWTDGNMSCDCNRGPMFSELEGQEFHCFPGDGSLNRFILNKIEFEDGSEWIPDTEETM